MKVRQRGLVQGLLALVVAAACGSDTSVGTISATPSPTAQASSTPTPQVTPTPAPPSPTPAAVLDDHFGFLIHKYFTSEAIPGPIGWKVRREGNPQPIYTLHTGSAGEMKVSPDGRRLAYMSTQELRVLDVSPTARPRSLLIFPKGETSIHIAWSSDGTGLVLGVNGGGGGVADSFPGYTAIRIIDVAGGPPHELVRVPNSNIVPLSWDRQAKLIAAYEPFCCGSLNYDTLTEGGTLKRTQLGDSVFVSQASMDAKYVFSRNLAPTAGPFSATTLLRVWPVDSYANGVEIRAATGKAILDAAWRPGTTEIGVLFDDHLEFWNARGARRSISLPAMPPLPASNPNANVLFRADGKAVLIDRRVDSSATNVYVLAVDLASGETAVVDWSLGPPQPGTSVSLGPTQ